MRVPIRPDLLVAIETERDSVLFVIRAARGLVNNMRGFDIRAALLSAEAAMPHTTSKYSRFHFRAEGHVPFLSVGVGCQLRHALPAANSLHSDSISNVTRGAWTA